MKNISEYDMRQLKLMLQSLASFENNLIELSSLIGTLEFLLRALEFVEKEWNKNFLDEVITLETINAIEINNENGEEYYEINPVEKKALIKNAIFNLKTLIEKKINE